MREVWSRRWTVITAFCVGSLAGAAILRADTQWSIRRMESHLKDIRVLIRHLNHVELFNQDLQIVKRRLRLIEVEQANAQRLDMDVQ